MTAREGAATRTDLLYGRVRADVLGGRLVPGQRLKFPQFCERYETSVGAAREVMARLQHDGLVIGQARKGYAVKPLSHADLADLTQARIEIETLVIRLSVSTGATTSRANSLAAHYILEHTPFLAEGDRAHPGDEWSVAHARFHRAVLSGCPNRRLVEAALALRAEAELYQHWSVAFGDQRDRDVAAEHRNILAAIISDDAEEAAERVREHIAYTARVLISCAPDTPNTAHHGRPPEEPAVPVESVA